MKSWVYQNKKMNVLWSLFKSGMLFVMAVFLLCACYENNKITPYLKPLSFFETNFNQRNYLNQINFLFFIDDSGSMDKFKTTLAKNTDLFLKPIFSAYPYYNYNFAITTMSPNNYFERGGGRPRLYFNSRTLKECGLSESLETKSNLGSYVSYNADFSKADSVQNILCFLQKNIQNVEGDGGIEPYFENLSYILKNADFQFKTDFFDQDGVLVLFYISDAWEENGAYKSLLYAKQPEPAVFLAEKAVSELQGALNRSINIRTYGVVTNHEKGDSCGEGSLSRHPFHFYEFVKRTQGLIISICDPNWGLELREVYKDFVSVFVARSFYLNEIPQIGSIEVFLNDIEVPNDFKKGWSLNLEKMSIDLGPELNLSYYKKNRKGDEDKVLIRYHPLNIELLY